MKSYDPALLKSYSPTDLARARTWARHLAGDYPINVQANPPTYPLDSWVDDVWDAWLERTAYVVRDEFGTVLEMYYRPAEAAAQALMANPHWLQRETVLGASYERRSLADIVRDIRAVGQTLDKEIERLEGQQGRPFSATGTWEVVW